MERYEVIKEYNCYSDIYEYTVNWVYKGEIKHTINFSCNNDDYELEEMEKFIKDSYGVDKIDYITR